MADEAILTDTTTSQTDAPAVEAPVPAPEDGSVLGGETKVDAPSSDAPAVEVVAGPPEKYELALEGFELDAAMVDDATPVLQSLGLDNDQANALMPVAAKLVQQTQDRTLQQLVDAGAEQRKSWLDAFASDPEIGGTKRQETEHLAAKGMDALGFKEGHPFRAALTESGFGNHPDMIRAFRALGQMVAEDGSFVRSNDGVKEELPIEKRLYPND